MSEPLPISTLKQIIWGDGGFEPLDKSDPDTPDENPFPEIILKNQVAAALGKSDQRPSVVLDMSVPQSDVDEDSFELYKTPRIVQGVSGALKKTSGKKFVELLALVRKVFDGHEEEMHEAIETVTRMRDDERNAMLAQIAAAQ